MKAVFKKDLTRWGGVSLSLWIREPGVRFMWVMRNCQESCNPIWKFILWRMREKYGLGISPRVQIGPGFYLGHPYGIDINPAVSMGANCNVHKGVTIGQENRGRRKGAPCIGDGVWMGVNSTIVGRITIGDDVLIAPNSYVNFDVPSHSIVIGNPAKIIHRDNATENYIENKCIA